MSSGWFKASEDVIQQAQEAQEVTDAHVSTIHKLTGAISKLADVVNKDDFDKETHRGNGDS